MTFYVEKDRLNTKKDGYGDWQPGRYSAILKRFLSNYGAIIISWRPSVWGKIYEMSEFNHLRMMSEVKKFLNYNKQNPFLISLFDLEQKIVDYIEGDSSLVSLGDLEIFFDLNIGYRHKLLLKFLQNLHNQFKKEYMFASLFDRKKIKYQLPPHLTVLSDSKNGWYNNSGKKHYTLLECDWLFLDKENSIIMEGMVKKIIAFIHAEKERNHEFNETIFNCLPHIEEIPWLNKQVFGAF